MPHETRNPIFPPNINFAVGTISCHLRRENRFACRHVSHGVNTLILLLNFVCTYIGCTILFHSALLLKSCTVTASTKSTHKRWSTNLQVYGDWNNAVSHWFFHQKLEKTNWNNICESNYPVHIKKEKSTYDGCKSPTLIELTSFDDVWAIVLP